MRRSSGFWAAGTLRIASRSCSNKLARRFSVILLFRGESPPGINSALELSMLGLVRVMSSLLAIRGREKETQNFYIPQHNDAKIISSGCFYVVFPNNPFRFAEQRKWLSKCYKYLQLVIWQHRDFLNGKVKCFNEVINLCGKLYFWRL